MNYEYLKVFYHVAINKSFSKTALELYTSQPAISRIIQSIETELSCKLFIRTRHGIILTKEGENLFEKIEGPFNQLDRLDKSLIKNDEIASIEIYIGATFTSLQCYVFDLLKSLRKKFPNVHYQIYTGSTSKILELVKSEKIDIAFVTTPFDHDSSLDTSTILKIKDVIIGGEKFKDLAEGEHSIKELVDYPFILLSNDSQFRIHLNNFLYENKTKISPEFETDSIGTVLPMVEKNYGLTFMPYTMAKESIQNNKSYIINIKENIPPRKIIMVTSSKHHESKNLSQVKEYITNKRTL